MPSSIVHRIAVCLAQMGRKLPYLRLEGNLGKFEIWRVDGAYIRTVVDDNFTNFGQHYVYSYIPENELWLDVEIADDEKSFFVDHLLVEHRLMAKGMPYSEAIVLADNAEHAERRKAGDTANLPPGKLPPGKLFHVKLVKALESGVTVWVIDGRKVRSVLDVDFTEGGHEFVYEFVPDSEVWLDNDLVWAERPFVLLHELHERNLMAKGWFYNKAHASALKVEYQCRHAIDDVHDALMAEGWG